MVDIFFKNEAKEIIKKYLFWVDFLEQSFSSIDELKEKLKTIKDRVVYQGEFKEFYLTQEEAKALGKKVKSLSVQEVLDSNTYPLYLIERLSIVTSYSKNDLKHIPRGSEVVWLYSSGILMHFVFKNGKYIYPKDYPVDNPYRYGYLVVFNKNGLQGIYDLDSDSLKIPFEYNDIELFGNLAQLSKGDESYEIIDLDTDEVMQKDTKKILPNITDELKERLNFTKVDLEDYIAFFDTAKTEQDLMQMGLWSAKVGIVKLPSGYDEIIKESIGEIGWEYPVSADIFDMSIELPVMFKKKNGEYVTLGIKHVDIILEDRTILNNITLPVKEESKIKDFQNLLKRGNLPDDDRDVPTWLQIKNETYKTIPIINKIIEDIVSLEDDEFMEFMNKTINQNVLFTALSTAKDDELKKFYKFLEKGEEGLPAQFKKYIEDFRAKEIAKEQLDFALMVASLYPAEVKKTHHQLVKLHQDMNKSNFSKDDELLFDLEYSMNSVLFHSTNDLNVELKKFISLIKEKYEEGKIKDEFCKHIASKFAPLFKSIDKVPMDEYTTLEHDLKWFLKTFVLDDLEVLQDDSILHQLILLQHLRLEAILNKNQEEYLDYTVAITRYFMAFYPYLKISGLFYIDELINFVAHKDITIKNANNFMELFEILPVFYSDTSYENIIEFKEFINKRLATWKPQDNKIFDEDGVKHKMILLNYLVDMEDLYYDNLPEGENR